jgi:hypothetical protein
MKLILICVFNPTQLGFDINNEEINKKLPERVCLNFFSFFINLIFRFLIYLNQ